MPCQSRRSRTKHESAKSERENTNTSKQAKSIEMLGSTEDKEYEVAKGILWSQNCRLNINLYLLSKASMENFFNFSRKDFFLIGGIKIKKII